MSCVLAFRDSDGQVLFTTEHLDRPYEGPSFAKHFMFVFDYNRGGYMVVNPEGSAEDFKARFVKQNLNQIRNLNGLPFEVSDIHDCTVEEYAIMLDRWSHVTDTYHVARYFSDISITVEDANFSCEGSWPVPQGKDASLPDNVIPFKR